MAIKQAFVIMQIGNKELEKIYDDVIESAIKSCQLIPRRVDKHNEGGLLKSEIIKFIGSSDIIVADITNARPNCYLEIGYTMGFKQYLNEATYKYNNKAEVLNLFLKGKMPLKDLQDIATKDFGTDIATKAELEMFLKNKFMQDLMSDEHGIPVATLIKKIKELLKNI